MKAEYFPPREDIILQNEAPTDFYILVNGAVVLSLSLCLSVYLSPVWFGSIRFVYDAVFLVTGADNTEKWNRSGI